MATILIAEDELIEAMAMQVTLEKWGHRVLPTITDGEDVAKVASTARPDLIMMDVFLANGVTGIEAARRIPPESAVKLIFVTASDDASIRTEASELGYDVFLRKPYTDLQLRAAIDSVTNDDLH